MGNNSIIEIGRDLTLGVQKFSFDDVTYERAEAENVLREALKEANGGSTVFDKKALRRNKAEIFEILEALTNVIVKEGFKASSFFNRFVVTHECGVGDEVRVATNGADLYIVSEVANGINKPRRQRIGKKKLVNIAPLRHIVRIFDEYSLFVAGKIDWADLCARVSQSFYQQLSADIYSTFASITTATPGMDSSLIKTGTWDEETLLDICATVEAHTGLKPMIAGTAKALRKAVPSIVSDSTKDDLYNMGHVGKFYGYDAFSIPQVITAGGTSFAINDNVISVVAVDGKFIHVASAPEGTEIIDGDNSGNADGTLEYMMAMYWNVAVGIADKGYGRYTVS